MLTPGSLRTGPPAGLLADQRLLDAAGLRTPWATAVAAAGAYRESSVVRPEGGV